MEQKKWTEMDWEMAGVALSAIALFISYMRFKAKKDKQKTV